MMLFLSRYLSRKMDENDRSSKLEKKCKLVPRYSCIQFHGSQDPLRLIYTARRGPWTLVTNILKPAEKNPG